MGASDLLRRLRDAGRGAVPSPVQFCRSAIQTAGPQRQLLLDAVKAGVAATLAWVLATEVLHTGSPWLAPYAALFVIGTTVHQSMRSAARQVAVVALGVLLAAGTAFVVPSLLAALPVTVVVGTVIGRWRPLQPDGYWVPITALLLLTYGTANNEVVLLSRVIDVALGVAVGFVVNAVILPPAHLQTALTILAGRGREIADLLDQAADGVEQGVEAQTAETWRHQVWQLQRAVSVEQALTEGRESLQANPRRLSRRSGGDANRYLPAATALDSVLLPLSSVMTAVGQLDPSAVEDDDGLFGCLAELLRTVGNTVRIAGQYPATPADGATADEGGQALQCATDLLARAQELNASHLTPDGDGVAIGTVLMSARRVIDILDDLQSEQRSSNQSAR